jgi:hypothetical protein
VRGSKPCAEPRLRGERGAVGGIEVLPFGLLTFVVGSLLVANVWAVVDTKLATVSAAREAARVYVESADPEEAASRATHVASESIRGLGRDPDRARVHIEHVDGRPWARCTRALITVTYRLPALSLPWIGGYTGEFEVRAEHTEIIDPFRNGLTGVGTC